MSHCHTGPAISHLPGEYVALAGNPNTGKSMLFQRLTGAYAEVSNYPGTTLEILQGRWGPRVLVDTPGVYGVSSFSPEEAVARDILLGASAIINVVNAAHLERDLFLTQQLIDAGLHVVVALNMMDEIENLGMGLNVQVLARELGVPVVPMVARTGRGVDALAASLTQARVGTATQAALARLTEVPAVGSRAEALLVLEGDAVVSGRWGQSPGPYREELYQARRQRVEQVVATVVRESARVAFRDRLSRWLIRPVPGLFILMGVLWLAYKIIGEWVAQDIVGFTEETVMQGIYEPFIRLWTGRLLGEGSAVYSILAGEFGVLTMTTTYVIGLIFPLVTAFYLVMALLEDTGYLPRIATLLDRVMGGMGMNGKAIIPVILGFGCVTMATITTRMLSTERERRIATYLLALAVPCSAQLAVITLLLAGAGPGPTLAYVLIMLAVFIVAGMLLDAILPGAAPPLFLDLPPLRLPETRNLLIKTWVRTRHFITEATPLFAIGAILLAVLDLTGALMLVQGWVAPLTEGWLGLPRETATAFVMGFVRRDFGAAGLSSLTLTAEQTVTSLVTITLFVPCIASALVLLKERGRVEGTVIWFSVLATAFLLGGLVHNLGDLSAGWFGEAGRYVLVGAAFVTLAVAAPYGGAALRHRRHGGMGCETAAD